MNILKVIPQKPIYTKLKNGSNIIKPAVLRNFSINLFFFDSNRLKKE